PRCAKGWPRPSSGCAPWRPPRSPEPDGPGRAAPQESTVVAMGGRAEPMPRSLARAALVISVDTELAGGAVHHQATSAVPTQAEAVEERERIRRLLDLLDRHEVPATFAMVGHLLLQSCSPRGGVKHPEIVRPGYEWLERDWFEPDPGTNADD